MTEDRLEVLKKIEEYEKNGWFDRDVENDPPTRQLMPDEVEYTYDSTWQKLQMRIANRVAHAFFEKKIREKQLIIDSVEGIENFTAVKGGAMITCNHFNAFDNYAVYKAIEKPLRAEKRDLYKIIREGNYTSFPGLYGYFFRHCNTLPLGTRIATIRKMMDGVDTLLKRGEKILIYPEQGMWWNYKKPRPLKNGAFKFAIRSDVAVIPFFITMCDSDICAPDGSFVQRYTVHIMPAVYPDNNLPERERISAMSDSVYNLMKQKYEQVYGIPLVYSE